MNTQAVLLFSDREVCKMEAPWVLASLRIDLRFLFSLTKVFFLDQWPKSGVPGAFVAKIGFLSISVFATPPGRHLIGQRRPAPDDGHIAAG